MTKIRIGLVKEFDLDDEQLLFEIQTAYEENDINKLLSILNFSVDDFMTQGVSDTEASLYNFQAAKRIHSWKSKK